MEIQVLTVVVTLHDEVQCSNLFYGTSAYDVRQAAEVQMRDYIQQYEKTADADAREDAVETYYYKMRNRPGSITICNPTQHSVR